MLIVYRLPGLDPDFVMAEKMGARGRLPLSYLDILSWTFMFEILLFMARLYAIVSFILLYICLGDCCVQSVKHTFSSSDTAKLDTANKWLFMKRIC